MPQSPELISGGFSRFQDFFGFGSGAALGQELGAALGYLAADFGGGAVHGEDELVLGVAESFLIHIEVAEFDADGIAGGGAVEYAFEHDLGGDGIAFRDAQEAGEVEFRFILVLIGNDFEQEDILFQCIAYKILGIRDRARPLGNHLFKESTLAEGILKGLSWNRIRIKNLKIGAYKVFP